MGEIGASESCRERDGSLLCSLEYEFVRVPASCASRDATGVNPFRASRAAYLGLYG